MTRLGNAATGRDFLQEVQARSGQNLEACLQCGKCSGSCPICTDQVGGPRRLVATILYGLQETALRDSTWWYCVSCGTCMSRCPVEINMYRVATALCEMAEAAGVQPAEPDIHLFDKLFLESVARYGRAREVQVVMNFNVRTWRPFKDLAPGLTLLRKGALALTEMVPGGPVDQRAGRLVARVRRLSKEG
ncbi:MAG: 4Fe-4S dicluster domain-containing protein [Desulfobacca sp.]|uniref:4Fe-4S dicluster domain-containing protein n=1 Tax=Desulfobacca sp. TaxID=2067990 RepID=UPI00404B8FE1